MTVSLARRVFALTKMILLASLVATLAWAFSTIAARPLDGVEGDLFFEADRIRSGLPLYVDPRIGALEYGPPPSRFLVLYPPLWSAALALLPRGAAVTSGRIVASLAWFGAIALIVWRTSKERRRVVAIAGAFVAGIWVLALYGAMARPDAVAAFFSAFALERVTRRSTDRDATTAPSFDVLAGVAFALAAWIKPNVIGAAPGAFLGCVLATRGSVRARVLAVLPAAAAVVLSSLVVAGVLHAVSRGVWLEHLLASTGQPPDLSLWLEQIATRGPFFALPFAATLLLGLRARRDPGALVATTALATSLGWALLSLAKTGSATNYFMEPCLAMLIVLGRVDVPPLRGRFELALAALALGQVTWNGSASIRSAVREIPRAFDRANVLADVRSLCGATERGVVLADEPGLELALNGRLITTPFQTTHLVRRGRFPVALWKSDIASPAVECLVMQDDLLERPLANDQPAHDRFAGELREALRARFELVTKASGYFVYRVRERAPAR